MCFLTSQGSRLVASPRRGRNVPKRTHTQCTMRDAETALRLGDRLYSGPSTLETLGRGRRMLELPRSYLSRGVTPRRSLSFALRYDRRERTSHVATVAALALLVWSVPPPWAGISKIAKIQPWEFQSFNGTEKRKNVLEECFGRITDRRYKVTQIKRAPGRPRARPPRRSSLRYGTRPFSSSPRGT